MLLNICSRCSGQITGQDGKAYVYFVNFVYFDHLFYVVCLLYDFPGVKTETFHSSSIWLVQSSVKLFVCLLSDKVRQRLWLSPAQVALRMSSHMSPLLRDTTRTPTEGPAMDSVTPEAFLTLATSTDAVQYDLWGWTRELLLGPFPQQSHPHGFRFLWCNYLVLELFPYDSIFGGVQYEFSQNWLNQTRSLSCYGHIPQITSVWFVILKTREED